MALTTTQLRQVWGPECLPRSLAASVQYDGRTFWVHPATVPAWNALFAVLLHHQYDIGSGQLDDWSLNCRPITGGTNLSLHAFGIAIDINSISNPYGSSLVTNMSGWMISDILAIQTTLTGQPVFRWGGNYANKKDAMHFEVVVTPQALRLGVTNSPVQDITPPVDWESLVELNHYLSMEVL